ncbi:Vi polysaccharide biosynthesis UDP-N-acetylglucosamine C-6 dehydrogenase TviB [Simiduia agarivorans]|uniref:Polysaccharide biosynthesis protein n=1 Tax=Simiduia agarivorans (strain DSM 21679 / JCM 13881 / BCRC 17597 / SA1) TaxID=1117647 RepID=K4KL62_SIMAS|nr:Vi polysaccharide biosynthesis UDP-N-acetylglucosamine C-6 dehydrogenase TviB [Simiduia agarivorans]AFU98970.1 polysaccharide biosynthesis protein [Simiduia agarivorans SA1 = DSM 21679]
MFNPSPSVCVIGLGYVGLPLAVEFGKQVNTLGFDIHQRRITELNAGKDHTLELSSAELAAATHIRYTANEEEIKACDVYIVTVPTPITDAKQPDLTPLQKASELLGRVIGKNSIVVFESTVYPGCTEEYCIPIIERVSGLAFNQDFYAGYSPERINPGDKAHRVHNIVKVTSGSTPEVADYVDALYRRVVTVGTHKASSIKVAEAAKVIENTQRDINIALVNELALIFKRLNIDTLEVLEAAGTKWNFLPFRPGLVGGHCISVDPYYLTHKAQQVGYNPEVILAGRRINDSMGGFVAETVIKMMTQRRIHVVGSRILLMGLAFKENCPDLRNTRVVDIVAELKTYHADIDIYDPWVDPAEAEHEYGLTMLETPQANNYDAIIICVGHQQFRDMGAADIRKLGKSSSVLFDVKHILPKDEVDGRL